MIKIVVPANMPTAISHLEMAGWKPNFIYGQDRGEIESTGDRVVRLRSLDIPAEIDDTCDVGLVGNDCVIEKELELGLNLEVLKKFLYGRAFNTAPSLDLVGLKEDTTKQLREIKPGSIVLTECPYLTKQFLEDQELKVAIHAKNENNETGDVPTSPKEFRNWCGKRGLVGIRIVHGKIHAQELVHEGAGYGVMVNETGSTLLNSGLRVIKKILDVEILLIADREVLGDPEKGPQIRRLAEDLDQAYFKISQEYESSVVSREIEI